MLQRAIGNRAATALLSTGAVTGTQLSRPHASMRRTSASLGTSSTTMLQRYVSEQLPRELLDPNPLKIQLLSLIRAYNALDKQVKPDYYEHVYFTQNWYDTQVATLTQLEQLIAPGVENKGDPYTQSILSSLLQNLSAEKQRLAMMHIQCPPAGRQPLPKQLHFIWSGGAIKKIGLQNVHAWAKRAASASWRLNVWTDERNSDWSAEVLTALKKAGVHVHMINEGTLDPRLWPAYQTLMAGRAYPAASDLARYSILKTHGGIYIDVDISPGNVSLEDAPTALPTVPILAPEIRDSRSVREGLKLESDAKITKDNIREIASQRLAKGQHNNSFIMSSQGSAAMEAIIKDVVRALERRAEGAQYLVDNQVATVAITGPAVVKRALHGYLRESFPNLSDEQAMDVLTEVLKNVPDLDWLTAESEAQEH